MTVSRGSLATVGSHLPLGEGNDWEWMYAVQAPPRVPGEDRLAALRQVLEEKLVKRGVSLKGLDYGDVQEATQNTVRQVATIKVGISSDKAREINKLIKSDGPKGVSSQTQGESVRVSGKKRDDLQAVMAMLRAADLEIPLQFENFRD